MMNDLHKKKEVLINGYYVPGAIPHGIGKLTTTQLYYKKLGAYLLLLYQSYLKGETALEPEIKMALWRMVKFNKEFPTKIRMSQLDYLRKETASLNGAWDEEKDILFFEENLEEKKPLANTRKKLISEYKDAVTLLLASHS